MLVFGCVGLGFFWKYHFMSQTIPKQIQSILFFWLPSQYCIEILKLSAFGPGRDCAKVSPSYSILFKGITIKQATG